MQLAQLDEPVGRQQIGTQAHHLTELDERRPQLLQGPPNSLRRRELLIDAHHLMEQ
jgi:hypothetical protein